MARAGARGRRTIVLIGLAAAITVVTVVVVARTGDDRATAVPRPFSIVYELTENGVRHWEVLTVTRPFRGSDLIYDGASAPRRGDRPSSGTISTDRSLYTVDAGTVRLLSGRQPGPASGDRDLTSDLGALTKRSLARATGTTRRISSRSCRVYRFAEPPVGPIRPLAGGDTDHDDLCLARDGLVLSETWTYRGAVVLDRRAVDVRTSVAAIALGPSPPSTADAAPAVAGTATATPEARPTSFLAPPPRPQGFRSAGLPVAFRLPDPRAPHLAAAASVIWAFVDGSRFITVEAGLERAGQLPWRADDTPTTAVHLRGLGPAVTAVRSDGIEVRVGLRGGRWVRVRGSVPIARLTEYAQSLALVEASG